jgi:hypothetical protein
MTFLVISFKKIAMCRMCIDFNFAEKIDRPVYLPTYCHPRVNWFPKFRDNLEIFRTLTDHNCSALDGYWLLIVLLFHVNKIVGNNNLNHDDPHHITNNHSKQLQLSSHYSHSSKNKSAVQRRPEIVIQLFSLLRLFIH